MGEWEMLTGCLLDATWHVRCGNLWFGHTDLTVKTCLSTLSYSTVLYRDTHMIFTLEYRTVRSVRLNTATH